MYFTIQKDKDGYRARAYGDNNRLVWWTEGYDAKASAENAIAILQNGAAHATVYDRA